MNECDEVRGGPGRGVQEATNQLEASKIRIGLIFRKIVFQVENMHLNYQGYTHYLYACHKKGLFGLV